MVNRLLTYLKKYTITVKNSIKGFVSKLAAKIVPRITPVATKNPKPFTILKSTALC